MNKIIYIFERRHYYKQDDIDFGINYFRNQGYSVEVWSIVRWTFGVNVACPQNVHDGELIYIDSIIDFRNRLDLLSPEECFFIVYPNSYRDISGMIRKEMYGRGFKYANLSESSSLSEIRPARSKSYYAASFLVDVVKAFVALTLAKFGSNYGKAHRYIFEDAFLPLLYPATFDFVCGKNQLNYLPSKIQTFLKRTVIVPHVDYMKSVEEHEVVKEKHYAVFLDQYLPFHSDFAKSEAKPVIVDSSKYYDELNNLFDIIEKMGYEVIIAEHPKAEYENDEFCGRRMFINETETLIKYSDLVIFDYSSAISWALIYEKDILHIQTSQELVNDNSVYIANKIDDTLKTEYLDISRVETDEDIKNKIKKYDDDLVNLCEYYIMGEENNKKNAFEIILEHIERIYPKH